jgi:hypothetical protein
MWWESDSGILYIYYNDGTTSQWVQASPSAGGNVIAGTTSGTITLAAPAVAGTNTVTFPARTAKVMLDGPAFAAYGSAFVSATNNVATKLNYDTTIFTTGSDYNAATSRFTPTVAGYYQVNARLVTGAPAASNAAIAGGIFKNGSAYTNNGTISVTGIAGSALISCIVYLNGSTDYIEFYGTQNTGAALTMGSFGTNQQFSACLIRGA